MNNILTVLILQYEGADLTCQLLESIKEHGEHTKYRFVLMDNGSKEGKLDEIQRRFSWVEIVRFSKNLGFAKAHNEVMKQIRSDWILLLNNDCILHNDAISRTLRYAVANNADFATCKVLNADGSDQINFSYLPSPLRRIFLGFSGFNKMLWQFRRRSAACRVGYINGAFLLLKTQAIPESRLFSEAFFMYTEDLDLMIRLAKARKRGYRINDGVVVHLGGASAVKRWRSLEISATKVRQEIQCYEMYYPTWQVKTYCLTRRIAKSGWLMRKSNFFKV
jgi:N-acetylglucosaminyl-diphospho-decaprenol L-rhamnosyltransferase